MSFVAGTIIAIVASGPIMVMGSSEGDYEIGYEELIADENAEALAIIERGDVLAHDDPARLINHGVALARTGQLAAAREKFSAVALHRERLELETNSGGWVDSRNLAERALAMIDAGAQPHRFALLLR